MDSEIIAAWNICVTERLSPAELVQRLDGWHFRERKPDSPVLIAEEGLFVMFPPLQNRRTATRIQAIRFSADERYFAQSSVRPRPVQGRVFWGDVLLSADAATVLESLKRAGHRPLDLMRQADLERRNELYTIVVGRSVVLEFLAEDGGENDPQHSTLRSVEFNFGPEYVGTHVPRLRTEDPARPKKRSGWHRTLRGWLSRWPQTNRSSRK